MRKILAILISIFCIATSQAKVICGADCTNEWRGLLKGKRVALLANHTATTEGKHILDKMLEEHIDVVEKLIAKLTKPGTQVLRCYNKAELVSAEEIPVGDDVVKMSAKLGIGMDALLKAIERALGHSRHHITVTLPYSMGGMVETLHNNAQVLSTDYTGEGIVVETIVDDILYGRLKQYITKEV